MKFAWSGRLLPKIEDRLVDTVLLGRGLALWVALSACGGGAHAEPQSAVVAPKPAPVSPSEPTTPEGATTASAEPAPAAESKPGESQSVSIAGTRVLHVGDSFAGALGPKLNELLRAEGVHPILESADSSYIVDWAHRKNLDKLVGKYTPDLVIVTLGANELAMIEPEQRTKAIRKVVSHIGDRPCVWVAIPYWNESHNQLMEVVRKNVGPCVFHDTNALMDVRALPRVKDGIHPTEAARASWAKFFFDWMLTSRRPTNTKPWALAEDSGSPKK